LTRRTDEKAVPMAMSAGSESMTLFYYDFFAGGGMVLDA
jgi:hypothetical protein